MNSKIKPNKLDNADIKSNHSTATLGSLREKDKNTDSIPFRIEFIRELLRQKTIEPLIDLDETGTDNFVNIGGGNDTRIQLKKKIHDFHDAITQIGGNLLYIKSGTTGHTFKGVITGTENDMYNYGVKVVAYPKKEKYGTINDTTRPENAEIMMIKLLSYFVINKRTPHIVLPIGTFYTSIKPFITIGTDDTIIDSNNEKYQSFIKKYSEGEYYNKVSILISEWANRGDLLDFVRKNYDKFKLIHWKVIFFQIISTLAVIQYKYPSFRHNDLKANNILVQKTNVLPGPNKFVTYTIIGNKYYVPNIGYQIKLWDFDFACIPGIIDNSKVSSEWTKSINVTPHENKYYDIHYFFNTLIKKGFFPQFLEDPAIPQEAKDFVHRIVPDKYKSGKYVHKRGRILINDEYVTPDDIIKNDIFFNEFRKNNKSKKIKKPIENNKGPILFNELMMEYSD